MDQIASLPMTLIGQARRNAGRPLLDAAGIVVPFQLDIDEIDLQVVMLLVVA
jgi:hypothetical protein